MDAARIELGGATDVGRRREHNEDAWTVFGAGPDGAWKVAIVADGMGGHNAGEVASALAIEVIERELGVGTVLQAASDMGNGVDATDAGEGSRAIGALDTGRSGGTPGELAGALADPAAALRAAIERANREIWDESRRDSARSGMGTTVVGAIFAGGTVYLANVGDSPAFLVRGGKSRQVTRDHGWVAEQVEAGYIAPDEAAHHPYRNMLTRCLGTERSVAVEMYEPLDLEPGDQVILCSDGLTAHAEVEEVGPVVARATPTAAARLLISLANERGGQDNITVIVARVAAR